MELTITSSLRHFCYLDISNLFLDPRSLKLIWQNLYRVFTEFLPYLSLAAVTMTIIIAYILRVQFDLRVGQRSGLRGEIPVSIAPHVFSYRHKISPCFSHHRIKSPRLGIKYTENIEKERILMRNDRALNIRVGGFYPV